MAHISKAARRAARLRKLSRQDRIDYTLRALQSPLFTMRLAQYMRGQKFSTPNEKFSAHERTATDVLLELGCKLEGLRVKATTTPDDTGYIRIGIVPEEFEL